MQRPSEEKELLHAVNNAITALIILNLVCGAISWLHRQGKIGAHLASSLVAFIPMWLLSGMVVGSFYDMWGMYNVDEVFKVGTAVAVVASLAVAIKFEYEINKPFE